jgi:hypothetical protein
VRYRYLLFIGEMPIGRLPIFSSAPVGNTEILFFSPSSKGFNIVAKQQKMHPVHFFSARAGAQWKGIAALLKATIRASTTNSGPRGGSLV